LKKLECAEFRIRELEAKIAQQDENFKEEKVSWQFDSALKLERLHKKIELLEREYDHERTENSKLQFEILQTNEELEKTEVAEKKLIEGFEFLEENLKETQEKNARARIFSEKREADLDDRNHELDDRNHELELRLSELLERELEYKQEIEDLKRKSETFPTREQEKNVRGSYSEKREADLDDRNHELELRLSELLERELEYKQEIEDLKRKSETFPPRDKENSFRSRGRFSRIGRLDSWRRSSGPENNPLEHNPFFGEEPLCTKFGPENQHALDLGPLFDYPEDDMILGLAKCVERRSKSRKKQICDDPEKEPEAMPAFQWNNSFKTTQPERPEHSRRNGICTIVGNPDDVLVFGEDDDEQLHTMTTEERFGLGVYETLEFVSAESILTTTMSQSMKSFFKQEEESISKRIFGKFFNIFKCSSIPKKVLKHDSMAKDRFSFSDSPHRWSINE